MEFDEDNSGDIGKVVASFVVDWYSHNWDLFSNNNIVDDCSKPANSGYFETITFLFPNSLIWHNEVIIVLHTRNCYFITCWVVWAGVHGYSIKVV